MYKQHLLIKDSVLSLFPEKGRGVTIFGSLIWEEEGMLHGPGPVQTEIVVVEVGIGSVSKFSSRVGTGPD